MGYVAMTASFAPVARLAHGGRLDAARRLFPNAPKPWIDLSTGVNPHAYPAQGWPTSAVTRLPDDDAFAALERAARIAYRPPPEAQVVSGAGVQAFIQMLPRAFAARRIAILGFTYAEHAACWRSAGAQILTVETIDDLADADVAVIVNPNNPDGRLVAVQELTTLAQKMTRRGGLLVIDESFMDFTPQHSVAELSVLNGVIVLRSFGKAYGLPGLRLGFALCASEAAGRLRKLLGPWAVSGPALTIGARALQDTGWLTAAALARQKDAARLDRLLGRAGFDVLGGAALYRLARHPEARNQFLTLCRHGVLTRDFVERPDWLRFGLPGDESDWDRLEMALEAR
jgi:cobalamin biosynthetic protein CobC